MVSDAGIRFVMEGPHALRIRQKKRARLVTACDACRVKKVKCHQANPRARCDACKASHTACLFGDRDKYHAERGMSTVLSSNHHSNTSTPSSSTLTSAATSPSVSGRSSPVLPTTPSLLPTSNAGTSFPWTSTSSSSIFGTTGAGLSMSDFDAQRDMGSFFLRSLSGDATSTPSSPYVNALSMLEPPRSSTSDAFSTGSLSLPPSLPSSPPNSPLPLHRSSLSLDGTLPLSQLSLQQQSTPSSPQQTPPTTTTTPAVDTTSHLFDSKRPRYPSSEYMEHLTYLFLEHFQTHFPFLTRDPLLTRVRNGTLPAVLANAIAALGARFSDNPQILRSSDSPRYLAGEPYLHVAKLLVVPMMSWPSVEVLHALVLIAWAEYGCARDSGLYMYSRMATAMLLDMGLCSPASLQAAKSDEERDMLRFTWWVVFRVDLTSSWVTGRPASLKSPHFEVSLPSAPRDSPEHSSRVLFAYLAQLFTIRDEVTCMMNDQSLTQHRPMDQIVSSIQSKLTNYYTSLPLSLHFTQENFSRLAEQNLGSSLLLLHLMFHGANALVHWPSLFREFDRPVPHSIEVAYASARELVSALLVANSTDSKSLLSNPFFDVPVSVAARAFLAGRNTMVKSAVKGFDEAWNEASLTVCMDMLKDAGNYWGGAKVVMGLLETRGAKATEMAVSSAIANSNINNNPLPSPPASVIDTPPSSTRSSASPVLVTPNTPPSTTLDGFTIDHHQHSLSLPLLTNAFDPNTTTTIDPSILLAGGAAGSWDLQMPIPSVPTGGPCDIPLPPSSTGPTFDFSEDMIYSFLNDQAFVAHDGSSSFDSFDSFLDSNSPLSSSLPSSTSTSASASPFFHEQHLVALSSSPEMMHNTSFIDPLSTAFIVDSPSAFDAGATPVSENSNNPWSIVL